MRYNTCCAAALAAVVTAFPLGSPGLAAAGPGPQRVASYYVTELGSLGGSASAGNSSNGGGGVTGNSNLPGDRVTRAVLWRGKTTRSLGTLGGPNSAVLWPVSNDTGLIVGVSETAKLNPLGEDWSCSAFFPTVTHH